ncbi:MAG: M24 family metallopeptidase [Burkholderiales bacterium]
MSAVPKPQSPPPSRMRDPISTGELQRRWTATRAAMRSAGIDAIVVQSAEDWMGGYSRWFTDQPATNAYPRSVVFPLEGLMTACDVGDFGKTMTLDGNDPDQRGVGKRVFTPSFNGAVDFTGRYDAELIAADIKTNGYRTVGIVCANGMYHGFAAGLQDLLKGIKLVDATDLVDEIKAIKSPEEIDCLRRTAAMQDELMKKVCEFIKPGMKEFEVSAYAQYQANLWGSAQGLFFCSSAPKLPGPPMNRYQQTREIQKGDVLMVLLEFNGPGGFFTELGRTLVLGKAPQELKDMLVKNRAAQEFDLGLLKPGASCREVFKVHNETILAQGGHEEKRILSHGQGYEMVERPLIRHDESMSIRENMHLAVHPHGGVQLIDNYIVGPNGPTECLHRTPKEIIELS